MDSARTGPEDTARIHKGGAKIKLLSSTQVEAWIGEVRR